MQPDVIADRYRVVRAVGQGGMGTVWLCTDETLHRQVAVKQIGALPGESPGDAARAMREARLAAALNHKNAVSIYDVVEEGGTTWLVMEYVPSRTLSQLLVLVGRLPPLRVAHIGAQVAAALSSAHRLGIVHRDIKPGNILVGEDDIAKISDFGIARGHRDARLTQTGMVTGTPTFFSPELARGGEPTFASDVWALGIALYIATEGAPPHEPQSNPLAMLSIIAHDSLPFPTHAGPLTGVLTTMLDLDARRRSSMAEAHEALLEVEHSLTGPGGAWNAATVATHEPEGGDPTSAFEETAVEPEYERPVAVPAFDSSWFGDDVPDERPTPDRRNPAGRLAALALATLVLIGIGAVLFNTLDLGAASSDDPASSATTGGPQRDKSAKPDDSPTSNPSTSETPTTSTTPDVEPTRTPKTEDETEATTSTATSPEAFTRSYFSAVPADLDAGWSLIAPSMQQALGRDSYDSFWTSIDSVELGDVEVIDDQTVRYVITYRGVDGDTSVETKQLTLQPEGGSYLITSDSPAG